MKICNIIGLYQPEMVVRGITERSYFQGDVWSLRDWWFPYPWLSHVDRSYEIHSLPVIKKVMKTNSVLYEGNFKKEFKTRCKEIRVVDKRWGKFLGLPVTILDNEKLKSKHPDLDLSSTIDIMMAEAIDKRYEQINIYGVYLQEETHSMYSGGFLQTVDKARSLGIKVKFDYEEVIRTFPYIKQQNYIDRWNK